MENIKVTVLVPCFNVEKYVQTCLDSIINQTLREIEILCINDGSTDSTREILESFAQKDSRIKIINKENTGYGDSMNLGLELAKGKYIGIVESDDYVSPFMFEKLYKQAIMEDLDISRCCFYKFNSNSKTLVSNSFVVKNKTIKPSQNTEVFLQGPSIWSAIYKTDWLRQNGISFLPTKGASYQDISFAFKANLFCRRYRMIEEGLLYYRTDNENSSSNNKGKLYCVCDEWAEIYRLVRSYKGKYKGLLPVMFEAKQSNYLWNYKRLSSPLKRKFLRRWIFEILYHLAKGEIPHSFLSKKYLFLTIRKMRS